MVDGVIEAGDQMLVLHDDEWLPGHFIAGCDGPVADSHVWVGIPGAAEHTGVFLKPFDDVRLVMLRDWGW